MGVFTRCGSGVSGRTTDRRRRDERMLESRRDVVSKMGDLAAEAGLERVAMLAWRDLEDPEAGGSEVHASTVASFWARAGIEVTMRTSFAPGSPQVSWRDGYRVIRKAGRYMVFPRAAFSEMMGWHGGRDGLVEIWNGMPFMSPVWARTPHVTWLHHVHADMWNMTLPPRIAGMGRALESTIAPKFYRRTPIVTLSNSSKHELVEDLGFKDRMVHVVPPGIDPKFSPGGAKADRPLVVAVGRLVPVKRFDLLVDVLGGARQVIGGRHPERRRVGAKDRLPAIGERSDLDPLCLRRSDDLVVDIGEVHHPGRRVPRGPQPAHQHIGEEEAAEVADVGRAIDRWPAGVDADPLRIDRHEGTFLAAQRVAQLQAHGLPCPIKRARIRRGGSPGNGSRARPPRPQIGRAHV